MTETASTAPSFRHVLLTRFNVRWDEAADGPSIGTSPEWLARRFILFERYCLPTLKRQSCSNFTWLIFFDQQTPQPFAEQAQSLSGSFSNIVPVFCERLPSELVSSTIDNLFPVAPKWLLTTRLDNDDGLHSDFVKNIQDNLRFDRSEILNFPQGVVISEGRTYLQRHLSNAFISLFEPFSDRRTIFSVTRHVYASDSYPVRQVPGGPMWLQVIHGGNISNRVRGRRILAKYVGPGFPVLDLTDSEREGLGPPESRVAVLVENMTIGVVRALASFARTAVRRGARLFNIDVRRRAKRPAPS